MVTRISGLIAIVCASLAFQPGVAVADPTEDDPSAAKLDPDYAAGKRAIEAKNWAAAIKPLSSAALRDTRNADIQNYLGYAYRPYYRYTAYRVIPRTYLCSARQDR